MSEARLTQISVDGLKRETTAPWYPNHGGADAEAEALRQEILHTEDMLVITGTKYYVSPNGDDTHDGTTPATAWQTVKAVAAHRDLFKAGDAVLFERGYVYRCPATINAVGGVTYAAYGTGEKPALYGSAANYALHTWRPTEKDNIWQLPLDTVEAGIIVFNHGVATGMPKYFGIDELVKNGDFHHDLENHVLYMYLDKGNPASVYDDIEIGTRATILNVPRDVENVTVDNLAFKYAGLFAFFVSEDVKNTRVTNCEFGWVGGCRFMQSKVGLGNAISYWQGAIDALVENCWIYQCYDAGITPQGVGSPHVYKNVVFRNNLIEYCNYSIEVFDRNNETVWDGLLIENNILRFAGYGFLPAAARPDSHIGVANYVGWSWNYDTFPGKGFVMRNNVFDCSAGNLVFWHGKTYTEGLTITGNSFYQKANASGKAIHFAQNAPQAATNQEELEVAVRSFEHEAKTVKWLD